MSLENITGVDALTFQKELASSPASVQLLLEFYRNRANAVVSECSVIMAKAAMTLEAAARGDPAAVRALANFKELFGNLPPTTTSGDNPPMQGIVQEHQVDRVPATTIKTAAPQAMVLDENEKVNENKKSTNNPTSAPFARPFARESTPPLQKTLAPPSSPKPPKATAKPSTLPAKQKTTKSTGKATTSAKPSRKPASSITSFSPAKLPAPKASTLPIKARKKALSSSASSSFTVPKDKRTTAYRDYHAALKDDARKGQKQASLQGFFSSTAHQADDEDAMIEDD